MSRRTLSSALFFSLSLRASRTAAFVYNSSHISKCFLISSSGLLTCLAAASSIWNSVSNPLSLIPCNKAVAMFICVSKICFLAVSSGRAVIAAFKCAALLVRSICEISLRSPTPVVRVISAASVLYLLSSKSISSATCGKGDAPFLLQKKSFESRSYVRFLSLPCSGVCSANRNPSSSHAHRQPG